FGERAKMIIIFNWVGVGIFLLSALVAAPFALLLGKTGTMLACGIAMSALDLGYRMKFGEGQILHPRRGGAFYYIPVWILGGVWIVACLCGAGGSSPQQVSARESWQATQASTSASQGSASRKSSVPSNQLTY